MCSLKLLTVYVPKVRITRWRAFFSLSNFLTLLYQSLMQFHPAPQHGMVASPSWKSQDRMTQAYFFLSCRGYITMAHEGLLPLLSMALVYPVAARQEMILHIWWWIDFAAKRGLPSNLRCHGPLTTAALQTPDNVCRSVRPATSPSQSWKCFQPNRLPLGQQGLRCSSSDVAAINTFPVDPPSLRS